MKIRFTKSYAYAADGFTIQNFIKDQEIDTEDERLLRAVLDEDNAAFTVPDMNEDDVEEDEDEEELDSDGKPVIKPDDAAPVQLGKAKKKKVK